MKVLTLQQPWASLVVMGAKRIETRSFNSKHRGPLLIHSSAGCKDRLYRTLCKTQPFSKYVPDFNALPMGAIIGRVDLVATNTTEFFELAAGLNLKGVTWEEEKQFGDYSPGRWGWLLADPVQFPHPIPAKGALGLWEFTFPGLDDGLIYQCTGCGFAAGSDQFPCDRYDTWCPRCKSKDLKPIIQTLPF